MILELLLWGLMATNNFDSGHAIIPVTHPSGEMHMIAVPEDTDMADFHAALGDAGYHHDLPQPTREGAIEYSPEFREAAGKAVQAVANFSKKGTEAGFAVNKSGKPAHTPAGKPIIQYNPSGRHLSIVSQPDDVATLHTHPADADSKPSPGDIDSTKKSRKVTMVASSNGLYEVDPEGNVQQVFKSPTWYSDKEPK